MSLFSSAKSTGSSANLGGNSDGLSISSLILVTCEDRWQVYHRLQDLDIECCCSGFQPLQVEVRTPTQALQLWSVLKRVAYSRTALVASLNRCWEASGSEE
ncbi:Asr1405/Asl0597 family protein [Synechococcus sp. PCC 7335]|uniref:Asr1405/Asl0597 family protein n=1 Tax=Synechococcus sp. (strain ATCC 29403 / PCC 7335) TaxID=91464 RepID=UPI0002FF0884